MARKRYKPEEIVAKLRQVDVLVSQGQTMVDAIRQIGVSEVTYYRWRQEFGGLKSEQVKRLKDLELENSRLRKAVSDLTPRSGAAAAVSEHEGDVGGDAGDERSHLHPVHLDKGADAVGCCARPHRFNCPATSVVQKTIFAQALP